MNNEVPAHDEETTGAPGVPRLGLLKKAKKNKGKRPLGPDGTLGQQAAARGTLAPSPATPVSPVPNPVLGRTTV